MGKKTFEIFLFVVVGGPACVRRVVLAWDVCAVVCVRRSCLCVVCVIGGGELGGGDSVAWH